MTTKQILKEAKKREKAKNDYNEALHSGLCPHCGSNVRMELDNIGGWYFCEGNCTMELKTTIGALWWKQTIIGRQPLMMWPK